MINKHDHIHRVTAADETITDVILFIHVQI